MKPNFQILVVMPVYNAMPYLQLALDSILNQTFKEFCLLSIDDGSKDGSVDFLHGINDPRLVVHTQQNSGPGAIMNNGLTFALEKNIPYIARMDADDISQIDRLGKQYSLLIHNPEIAACSCNCEYMDVTGKIIGSSTVPTTNSQIKWEILHGLRGMVQGAMLIRTQALADVGGYRKKFPLAEENDLFLRLMGKFQLSNVSDYLYKIRLHKESMSIANFEKNYLYSRYALDCFIARKVGVPEKSFEEFCKTQNRLAKINVKREMMMLRLWQKGMIEHSMFAQLLAALLDPIRVVARIKRKIDIIHI